MGERVTYKTPEEIEQIRESSLLVSRTLALVGDTIAPGVSTELLDRRAEEFIRDNKGIPAFKDYHPSFSKTPFPASLCISINEEVVHGMPSKDRLLKEGDIVSVDCGVLLNEFFGDSAYTFPVGEVNAKRRKLLEVTKESLMKGIERAIDGNLLGEISYAIQRHAETYGFSIVREMVGHGLGRELHEPPEVPNFGRRKTGVKLRKGTVLAIEPMVNMGRRDIQVAKDGWTVYAVDRQPSAHFEHTVVVGVGKAEILTTFEFIEKGLVRG